MRPFQYLDQPSLLDMLAYVTARYTKMYSNDTMAHNDYMACRELIRLLQIEFEARHGSPVQHDLKRQDPRKQNRIDDPV